MSRVGALAQRAAERGEAHQIRLARRRVLRLTGEKEGPLMKRNLNCPCGEQIVGTDEDDLVAKTKAHLAENHPGHDYSRDEILFIAY